jgi:hypothetical protein
MMTSDDRAPEGTDHHDGQAPSRSPEQPDLGQPGHLPSHTRDGEDQEPGNTRLPTTSGPAPPLAADPPAGAPPRPPIVRPPSPARRLGGNQVARRPQPRPSSAIAKHKQTRLHFPSKPNAQLLPVAALLPPSRLTSTPPNAPPSATAAMPTAADAADFCPRSVCNVFSS